MAPQEVLNIYDQRLRRNDSAVVLDLLDASALLWRLKFHEIDVGERWSRLAVLWEPQVDDAWYSFNDMHAMMSFAGAGYDDLARRLVAAGKNDCRARRRSNAQRDVNALNRFSAER
jgi:hypothetical protein